MEQTSTEATSRVIFLDTEQVSVVRSGLKALYEKNVRTDPRTASIADNILDMTERSNALATISNGEKEAGETIGCCRGEVREAVRVFLRLGEQEILEGALGFVAHAALERDPETSRIAMDLLVSIQAGDTLVFNDGGMV